MLKRLATLVLATSALMLAAPVAHADAPIRNCQFFANSTDDEQFDGVIAGYIDHTGQFDDVSIRCYIKVDFVEVASTLPATGIGTAAVAETLSFQAGEFDYVQICTDFTTSHGPDTECFETAHAETPFVVLDGICLVTEIIGGMGLNILGLLVIEPNGDVFVATVKVIDCGNRSVPPNAVRFST